MKETSQQIINHIRIMIEEVECTTRKIKASLEDHMARYIASFFNFNAKVYTYVHIMVNN